MEFNREVEKVPEVEKKHEEEMRGSVADESLLSEADSKLSGVSFVLAVGLSEAVITVRAEIKSASPWTATTGSPMISRGDGEEEGGQGAEEAETPCSFSLCCDSSACT